MTLPEPGRVLAVAFLIALAACSNAAQEAVSVPVVEMLSTARPYPVVVAISVPPIILIDGPRRALAFVQSLSKSPTSEFPR
jgi:hypothetical protein